MHRFAAHSPARTSQRVTNLYAVLSRNKTLQRRPPVLTGRFFCRRRRPHRPRAGDASFDRQASSSRLYGLRSPTARQRILCIRYARPAGVETAGGASSQKYSFFAGLSRCRLPCSLQRGDESSGERRWDDEENICTADRMPLSSHESTMRQNKVPTRLKTFPYDSTCSCYSEAA